MGIQGGVIPSGPLFRRREGSPTPETIEREMPQPAEVRLVKCAGFRDDAGVPYT
jgi:hypothetical protein